MCTACKTKRWMTHLFDEEFIQTNAKGDPRVSCDGRAAEYRESKQRDLPSRSCS